MKRRNGRLLVSILAVLLAQALNKWQMREHINIV